MTKTLMVLIRAAITGLPTGTIIDVPTIKAIIGRRYIVGVTSNRTWGRALSKLSKCGFLTPYRKIYKYGHKATTIHQWVIV